MSTTDRIRESAERNQRLDRRREAIEKTLGHPVQDWQWKVFKRVLATVEES